MKLDRRAYGRKPANLLATLICGRATFSCTIVELSAGGARIRLNTEHVAVNGSARLVSAQCGDHGVEIVWQQGPLVGLRFAAVEKRAAGAPAKLS